MAEAFYNKPSGKWVVRLGHLPEHLGGAPGLYDPADPPRLLADKDGKTRLFNTRDEALSAAGKP